jgi:hypothetical protein
MERDSMSVGELISTFWRAYCFPFMLMQSNKNDLEENGVFLHGCWLRGYHVIIQSDELMTVGVESFLYLFEIRCQS